MDEPPRRGDIRAQLPTPVSAHTLTNHRETVFVPSETAWTRIIQTAGMAPYIFPPMKSTRRPCAATLL